jgi:hypothetical protein
VPARTSPENHLFSWNLFAPRVGMVYDLSGDGRTVVKVNYGLWIARPGPSRPRPATTRWGIRLSPVLRHQSGVNYARTLTIPASPAAGISVSGATAHAEPANANREDNITVFDIRAEKIRRDVAADAADLSGSVQHHQQPRVRDDFAGDRAAVPEADRDPGPVHGPGRVPAVVLTL